MPSILSNVLNGLQRAVQSTASQAAKTTTASPTANTQPSTKTPAQASRPLDVFSGAARTLAQQPAVQSAVNNGVRMMFGMDASALAQRLQDMLPMRPAQAQAQAQEDMDALLARNPNPPNNEIVALLAQHPNDPEYAAHLIGAMPEEIQQTTLLSDLQHPSSIGGNDGKQLLLSAMRLARDHQPPLLDMGVLAQSPLYSTDVDNGMNGITDPAATLRNLATSSVPVQAAAINALTATSQATHAKLEELDQQLGRQLAQYGPGLTQAQRDSLIAAFKAEHPEYAQAEAADGALSDYMQMHQGMLQQAALNPNDPAAASAAAGALANAYESLAGTAHNPLVVDALQVPGLLPQLANTRSYDLQGFHDNVVAKAAQHLMTTAATSGNPDTILQQLDGIYSSMEDVAGLADQASTARQAFGQLGDALRTARQTKDWAAFGEALNNISEQAGDTSSVGRLVAGGGFLMGVGMIAEGVIRGDAAGRQEAMQGLMRSLEGSPAIGYGLEMLAESFPKVISEDLAKGVTGVLENVTDYLGLITSGLDFLGGMAEITDGEATQGDKMKVFSDFIGVLGGAAAILGANVFGVAAGALSLGTKLLGEAMQHGEQQDKNRQYDEQMFAMLSDPSFRPPVDPTLLTTLRDLPAGGAEAIASSLGMTPEQFVAIANRHPEGLYALATAAQQPPGPERLRRLTGELGLTPEQLAQLATEHPSTLAGLAMAADSSAIDGVATLQSRLGLPPGETFQLLTELSRTAGSLTGTVLDQVTATIRSVPEGGDVRAALQQLRDAGASSAGPGWSAAIEVILRMTP